MKKAISVFSVFSATLIAFFGATPAFAAGTITNVTGVVKDGNGNPAGGANVTAMCNNVSHSTTAQLNGSYQILFSTADNCTSSDTVSVTGSKGGSSGGASGQVHLQKNLGSVDLDFSVVNFSVPEFTTILGMIAGFTTLGGYLALRKRTM